MKISPLIDSYLLDRKPDSQYSSFDYCYSYFKKGKHRGEDMEKHCLTLAFYMASWGMFRGSSFLLQKSLHFWVPFIEFIQDQPEAIWDLDVDSYTEENIELILRIYNNLVGIRSDGLALTKIQGTKILLGVFGFIPGFDKFFQKAFSFEFGTRCGFTAINKNALSCIGEYYQKNKVEIDSHAFRTHCLDFSTGKETNIQYPKAKIVDMIGFSEGLRSAESFKELQNLKNDAR